MIPSLRTYRINLEDHFNKHIKSKYHFMYMERYEDPALVEENNLCIRVYYQLFNYKDNNVKDEDKITYLTYIFDQNKDLVTRTKYGFYDKKPETTTVIGMLSNMPSMMVVEDILDIVKSELINNIQQDVKNEQEYREDILKFLASIPEEFIVFDRNDEIKIADTFERLKNYINGAYYVNNSDEL
ncbi:Hypothetical protein ORPV_255 [Orpheovirus IHUMI-LCC2]|uniref:Uncharacterized protein n=1 Tax=Orpheovirus IHUMI-LCC2 TaxID=2023057 RepID=A0A2I2L3W8_9VIRU|nr:Hypothetical protein ORPV_255 [Orpheovirus IHUMI-LCC2]SNW62159.1 Hypothetical protein ORPV_255 [Orpheovirus IHUMI-LCC2]